MAMFNQQVSPPWQGGNRHLRRRRDCRSCRSCRASCRATAALLEDLGRRPGVESYGAAEGPGHHWAPHDETLPRDQVACAGDKEHFLKEFKSVDQNWMLSSVYTISEYSWHFQQLSSLAFWSQIQTAQPRCTLSLPPPRQHVDWHNTQGSHWGTMSFRACHASSFSFGSTSIHFS